MTDWIHENLTLGSGLIADGVWRRANGALELDSTAFTYCQGVALGAEIEAHRHTGDQRHLARIDSLLCAITDLMTVDGVIRGAGGGDGGLFGGILARNLALVATDLPDHAPDAAGLRARAAHLVTASADAAWANRAMVDGLPVFGHDWRTPAVVPTAAGTAARKIGGAVASSRVPERDLSVQISTAMLLEAAVGVTIRSREHIG